jgi:hypothetical protein
MRLMRPDEYGTMARCMFTGCTGGLQRIGREEIIDGVRGWWLPCGHWIGYLGRWVKEAPHETENSFSDDGGL